MNPKEAQQRLVSAIEGGDRYFAIYEDKGVLAITAGPWKTLDELIGAIEMAKFHLIQKRQEPFDNEILGGN